MDPLMLTTVGKIVSYRLASRIARFSMRFVCAGRFGLAAFANALRSPLRYLACGSFDSLAFIKISAIVLFRTLRNARSISWLTSMPLYVVLGYAFSNSSPTLIDCDRKSIVKVPICLLRILSGIRNGRRWINSVELSTSLTEKSVDRQINPVVLPASIAVGIRGNRRGDLGLLFIPNTPGSNVISLLDPMTLI